MQRRQVIALKEGTEGNLTTIYFNGPADRCTMIGESSEILCPRMKVAHLLSFVFYLFHVLFGTVNCLPNELV